MSLRDAWERHAEEWVRWARTPGHDSYWRFHRDRFLELLPPPGRLTLDVGCGEGRLARDLKSLGHRVVAIDASPTLVRHAREADPELDVLEADAAALPLADRCADLVVAFMSFQDIDDMPGAVREAGRVLEPGNRVCLAIAHPFSTAAAGFYFEHRRMEDTWERDGLRMTFISEHRPVEDYLAALAAAGFLVERLREIPDDRRPHVPMFLHVRALKPRPA